MEFPVSSLLFLFLATIELKSHQNDTSFSTKCNKHFEENSLFESAKIQWTFFLKSCFLNQQVSHQCIKTDLKTRWQSRWAGLSNFLLVKLITFCADSETSRPRASGFSCNNFFSFLCTCNFSAKIENSPIFYSPGIFFRHFKEELMNLNLLKNSLDKLSKFRSISYKTTFWAESTQFIWTKNTHFAKKKRVFVFRG